MCGFASRWAQEHSRSYEKTLRGSRSAGKSLGRRRLSRLPASRGPRPEMCRASLAVGSGQTDEET